MEGPLEDRSCTDILFLLLFAAFLVGMVTLFGIGVSRGNPHRILTGRHCTAPCSEGLCAGTDVAGNICGENNPQQMEGVSFTGKNLQSRK